jgi:hypothetical protein
MDEWQRLKHQDQTNRQWQALIDKLKDVWGGAFESRAFYARRVLDQAGPELVAQLAALPLSTQLQVAEAFSRSGSGVGMPVEDALFAAEQIASPTSRYRKPRDNDPEERELHELSRQLVSEFFQNTPDGNQPADPSEPPPPAGAEPTPEAKEAARTLMSDPGYWSKSNPRYAAIHRQVEGLLAGTIAPQAPQAPAQTSLQTPAVEGQTGGEDHA